MKDLILNVKKQWFDLVKSGKKDKEYREIKPYWTSRLVNKTYNRIIYVHAWPHTFTEMNSIIFPYNGYIITTIDPNEIEYDAVIKTLKMEEQKPVYAIILKKWEKKNEL